MLDPQDFVRSVCRGRARIRHESLKKLTQEEADALRAFISDMEGITSANINLRVGSLLITWDEKKTNADQLLTAAQFFLSDDEAEDNKQENCIEQECRTQSRSGEYSTPASNAVRLLQNGAEHTLDLLSTVIAPDVRAGGRSRRVTQNRLMLGGYAASIAALTLRSTGAHWVIGTIFTTLLCIHLYQHRRVL